MATKNPPDYRDRYCTHPNGNDGWWLELIQAFVKKLGYTGPLPKEASKEIFAAFDSEKAWRVESSFYQLLDFLREKQIGLGIISNWDLRLRGLLEKAGLLKEFSPVIISAEFGYEKPSPRIFQEAEKLSGRPPSQLIYVGDKLELDYYPSQALGWDSYLLTQTKESELPKGCRYIRNLADLLELKDWKI